MNAILLFSPILDIAIASVGIYLLFIFIKQTRSYFILYTLFGLLFFKALANTLDLRLTERILAPIFSFFVVIIVIVFQREIRRFFKWLALSRGNLQKRAAFFNEDIASYIASALTDMAKRRIGAIIVLSGEYTLDDIVDGGFTLDGKISTALLLSIFDDSTPGHDGAVLIENRLITKFGVHLPLAEDFKGYATMGTRHRAACGITERTDALALVVSEERGTISVAQNGALRTLTDKAGIEEILQKFIRTEHAPQGNIQAIILNSNNFLKVAAVLVATLLWFVFVFRNSSFVQLSQYLNFF
jgi:uncharacterized protein (TIGR00159 family)